MLICQSVRSFSRIPFGLTLVHSYTLNLVQGVIGRIEVPLTEIVPDIAMAQYKKVAFSKIEMGPVIGQGNSTPPPAVLFC